MVAMVSSRTPSRNGRSTLVSASTLWGSHFSQNQNQFHPGPRRNVPMMISDTQRMWKPTMKVVIIIGTFLRGPGWNWFWFWEKWDPHKVEALTNVDLPFLLGVRDETMATIVGA